MKIHFLLLLIIPIKITYADILLDFNNNGNYYQPIKKSETGLPINNSILKTIDGISNSFIVVGSQYLGKYRYQTHDPYILYNFKKGINIDMIVIKFVSNIDKNNVKLINIDLFNIVNNATPGITNAKIKLPNGDIYTNTIIATNVRGVRIDFVKYNYTNYIKDIYISEVEFWYKGKKHNVLNLEEAKREYIERVRVDWFKYLLDMDFDPVELPKINKQAAAVVKTWKGNTFVGLLKPETVNYINGMGVGLTNFIYYKEKVKDPVTKKENYRITAYIYFGLDKGIYVESKTNFTETEEQVHWDFVKVKIGKWDVDKQGRMSVQIGTNPMKYALGYDLAGTDLEGLNTDPLERDPKTGESLKINGFYKPKKPVKQWWEFWK